MTFQDDEILDFDFAGIEPAMPGVFIALPKGEYQVQCVSAKKYFTGESRGNPDTSKPNLEFMLSIINHPNYNGRELRLSHSLGESSRQFLLNTLMCLIPEADWQQAGLKIKLGELIQKLIGRTANGLVDWEITKSQKSGYDIVVNNLVGLKRFDATVPPPMPSEGNPPIISRGSSTPVAKQAAQGVVSQNEVANFLNEWPGGDSKPAQPTATPSTDFGF
jgi:hypothetical protein